MMQNAPLIIINVSNPVAFEGKGSIIILEYADEDAARKVARKIAREMRRSVAIRREDMCVIETFPATAY